MKKNHLDDPKVETYMQFSSVLCNFIPDAIDLYAVKMDDRAP